MRSCITPRCMVTVPFVQTLSIRQGSLYEYSCFFAILWHILIFHVLYSYAVFNFSWMCLFLSFSGCLHLLIDLQSAMNWVFNNISRSRTSWPGVNYNMVQYILWTSKAISSIIPDPGSFFSRQSFCKTNVHTRFYMNPSIISNI